MPKAAPDHRYNVSITMSRDLGDKLERVAAGLATTKNALMTALVAELPEDAMRTVYGRAVSSGTVKPKVNKTPEQKQLLAQLKGMDPGKLRELLTQMNSTGEA